MPTEWEAGRILPNEQILVDKLRERIQNEFSFGEHYKTKEDQDLYFVRWLRARELDLEKATNMLLTSIKWRISRGVDSCLQKPVDPLLKDQYLYHFPGADNDGHPVMLMPMARYDIRIVVDNKRFDEFEHFCCVMFESIMEQIRHCNDNRKPGQYPVTQFTVICDFKNYPYSQLLNIKAIKTLVQLMSVYEGHYPECVRNVIIINCTAFINTFLNLLKPIAAKRTMEKIVLYKSMEDWRKDINKFVDPNILPNDYK